MGQVASCRASRTLSGTSLTVRPSLPPRPLLPEGEGCLHEDEEIAISDEGRLRQEGYVEDNNVPLPQIAEAAPDPPRDGGVDDPVQGLQLFLVQQNRFGKLGITFSQD